MIDKEKIEEATVEQLENLGTYGLDEVDLGKEQLVALYREEDVKAMFRAGINWFKENLWHDASEDPKGDGEILVLCGNKAHYANTLTAHNRKVTKWRAYVEDWFITRWLYIEDLMKGGSND